MAALRRASAQVALRLPATAGVARSRASVLGTRAVDVSMGAKRAYTDGEAKYSGGNLPMNLVRGVARHDGTTTSLWLTAGGCVVDRA